MKTRTLRMLSMMIAAALLLTVLPAMAETTADGQITITIKDDRFNIEGIELHARLIATGDYGNWIPIPELAGLEFTTDEDDTDWVKETVSMLGRMVSRLGKPRKATTDKYGSATFSKLEHGIYYVTLGAYADPNLTFTPLLIAVPNKNAALGVTANSKHEYNQVFPALRRFERYVPIDDYETALGLGNIQMHVGVCYE